MAVDPSGAQIAWQLLVDSNMILAETDANSSLWIGKINLEPDTPDEVVTIFDLNGDLKGRAMTSGEYAYYPKIQVRIRSVDYPTGYQQGKALEDFFIKRAMGKNVVFGEEYNNIRLFSTNLETPLIPIGTQQDKNKRQVFVFTCCLVVAVNPYPVE